MHPDEDGSAQRVPYLMRVRNDDIADRIREIRHGGTGYTRTGMIPRFSLAGTQSKFALARHGERLFWSDSVTPSTHILKPESLAHTGLEQIEAATLDLARRAGVRAAVARQETFAGDSCFVIERFDRLPGPDGLVARLHAEDMTQALGRPACEKYSIHAQGIVALLRKQPQPEKLLEAFLKLFAFNVLIGNSDAHAENYSVLHTATRIEISPLYDAIPMGMFPEYDQSLSMPVGRAGQAKHVGAESWDSEARNCRVDPALLRGLVASVARGILEHLDDTLGAVPHPRATGRAL